MMFFFCSIELWLCAGGFMHDVNAVSAETVRVVFHSDDKTPKEFVHSLIRTVLAKSDRDARGEESLLNKLLNEMDGLKEDADILFVLTTNRPEELESALAGRPGRIDQAIEVPLPDEIGRGKLVRLYGKGLPLSAAVVDEASRRTEGVSAAFIKELMRRIAQSAILRDEGHSVISADIDEALNDMLFAGGRLNVKLLGGAQEMAEA
jgi:SpoVK/Ycf46/Vps4 family AAA+-type ATPase